MFAYRRKKRSKVFSLSIKASSHKINWRIFLWCAVSFLALVGLLYLIFWSSFFKIKNWSIEGKDFVEIAQAQELIRRFIDEKYWHFIPKNNLLLFSNQELNQRILSAFPEAQSIEVKKDIFKGIKILIKGRQPAAIWCQSLAESVWAFSQATTTQQFSLLFSDRCFYADNGGLIFREAPEISGTFLPTFFGQSSQIFVLGDQAIASSTLAFASQIKKHLRDIEIDSLGFVQGEQGSQELAIMTSEGWLVYFDTERSLAAQIKALAILLETDDIKNKRANLHYIDLRLANKVYYQ